MKPDFVGNAAVIVLFIVFVRLRILVVMCCRDHFGRWSAEDQYRHENDYSRKGKELTL